MVKRALILTWERFQDHELIYPYYSLKEAGFQVSIAANKLGRIHGDLGAHMPCDIEAEWFNTESTRLQYTTDYELLVIPGGVKALEKLRLQHGVLEFVRQWNAAGKTIFSVCNGAQLLISAGILKGRTVSGYYSIDVDIRNAGATYSQDNVVVDRNIVSCPHYDHMGEWMRIGYQVHAERMEKRGS